MLTYIATYFFFSVSGVIHWIPATEDENLTVFHIFWIHSESLVAQLVKKSACNAGDPGSIPGSGRSTGEGIGYPLQYSDLENSMDCIVHGVTKSQTQTEQFHFHFLFLLASLPGQSDLLCSELVASIPGDQLPSWNSIYIILGFSLILSLDKCPAFGFRSLS